MDRTSKQFNLRTLLIGVTCCCVYFALLAISPLAVFLSFVIGIIIVMLAGFNGDLRLMFLGLNLTFVPLLVLTFASHLVTGR